MFSFSSYSNSVAVTNSLLKGFSINIGPELIENELDLHPDYPSLLAISDVLGNFAVQTQALRITPEELDTLPLPFIAHYFHHDDEFVVVNEIGADTISLSNERWQKKKVKTSDFLKNFQGTVLIGQPEENPSTLQNKADSTTLIPEPVTLACLFAVVLALAIFNGNYLYGVSWNVLSLTICKTAGAITSIFLLLQSIDSNNPLIQKLCGIEKDKNCNVILSSKAAKISSALSWSEVGFFYFAGTLLLTLFANNSVFCLRTLFLLNVLGLPYTFYSIYYQARIAKQWCVLCCTVQGLLWIEFAILANSGLFHGHPEPLLSSTLSTIIISLIAPVLGWTLFKPYLLDKKKTEPLKNQLRQFKYNAEIFNIMLRAEPKYQQPEPDWSIVLGNPSAERVITMVTNPYCGPCATTHELLVTLLEERKDLQARIIFTASNGENDIRTPVTRHMMALNESADKSKVEQAMKGWYEAKNKDLEAWTKAYPTRLDEHNFYKLDKQKAWCEMADIKGTPTIFLDGYQLPNLYKVSDLKYLT